MSALRLFRIQTYLIYRSWRVSNDNVTKIIVETEVNSAERYYRYWRLRHFKSY